MYVRGGQVSTPDRKELINMTYTIADFDKALLYAYGADSWVKTYYWTNLLKIYHGLDKVNTAKANSLLNIFVSRLTVEEKIKFFNIGESIK